MILQKICDKPRGAGKPAPLFCLKYFAENIDSKIQMSIIVGKQGTLTTASHVQTATRKDRTMSRYIINLQNRIFDESIELDATETPTIYSVCVTDGFEISDVFEFAEKEDALQFIWAHDLEPEEEATETNTRWGHLINGVSPIDRDFECEDVIYYVSEPKFEIAEA